MRSEVRIQHWKERLSFIKKVEGIREGWDPCLQILEGHSHTVNAVAFSPDGKVLASATLGCRHRGLETDTRGPRRGQSCSLLTRWQGSCIGFLWWDSAALGCYYRGPETDAQNQHVYYKSVIFRRRSISENGPRVVKSRLWLTSRTSPSGPVNAWTANANDAWVSRDGRSSGFHSIIELHVRPF